MKSKSSLEQAVLITGGGSGIGLATARTLLEAGFGTIVIASRRRDLISEVAKDLQQKFPNQRVLPFAFDLRERTQVDALIDFVESQTSGIDVLINNSGLAVAETIDHITDDGWNRVLETNLRGGMWLIQGLLPGMMAREFGDIINIASQAGKQGYADVPAYCASKFGLLGLADSVRDHVLKNNANIRVVNICPALVDVESDVDAEPRPGFLHVRTMAKTILWSLQLDRNVILHDIGIVGR